MIISDLFLEQSAPWEAIARSHVDKVWKAAKEFLGHVAAYIADATTSKALATVGLWVSATGGLVVSGISHVDMRYTICGIRETCIHQEPYLYGQHAISWLLIRIFLCGARDFFFSSSLQVPISRLS